MNPPPPKQPPRQKTVEEIKAEAKAFALSDQKPKTSPAPVAVNPAPALTQEQASESNDLDDDYERFVQLLGAKDLTEESMEAVMMMDDDEDEFLLFEEEDDEGFDCVAENDEDNNCRGDAIGENPGRKETGNGMDWDDLSVGKQDELKEELGWLAEDEEMETLAPLFDAKRSTPDKQRNEPTVKTPTSLQAASAVLPATPEQEALLKELFHKHFQLLFQLSVQSVRAAKTLLRQKDPEIEQYSISTNHIDIVDQTVGMLQDLKRGREDAIRKFVAPQRQLFTRSQFRRADKREIRTHFDIPGLDKLNEAFVSFDKSVAGQGKKNILLLPSVCFVK